MPSRAEAAAKHFSLGDPRLVRSLFESAGFTEVEVAIEAHAFAYPSFDAYFGPVEQGKGATGAEFINLPTSTRDAVRADVRRELCGDADGPVQILVDILVAAGRRRR